MELQIWSHHTQSSVGISAMRRVGSITLLASLDQFCMKCGLGVNGSAQALLAGQFSSEFSSQEYLVTS